MLALRQPVARIALPGRTRPDRRAHPRQFRRVLRRQRARPGRRVDGPVAQHHGGRAAVHVPLAQRLLAARAALPGRARGLHGRRGRCVDAAGRR